MKKVTIFIPVYNQEELVIKALESIPVRGDIEILVIDDASTDNTLKNVYEYQKFHPEKDITIMQNIHNKGLGYTKNIGYENAKGEYIHQLDSDDYLYTEEYNKVLDQLDGSDIVYINLQKNDGSIFELTEESKVCLCAGTARLIKKEFLGDSRCPEIRAGEDWYLNQDLLKKNPTENFTGITAYHYNFPREGSLYDLMVKGQL